MSNPTNSAEQVDVVIIGSGPAGSTYARTIGDAVPDTRILMVEVGPAVPGKRGEHTMNMSEEDRVAAQQLTQGPDTGLERAAALSDIAPGIDPSLEFRGTLLPGLFFADPRPVLPDGEVGLPAASMASGVGGMGIHWGTSSPRPHQSERIPFVPEAEMDAALAHAEDLLRVSVPQGEGGGLARALREAMAKEFDGPGLTPTQFMPLANQQVDGHAVFSGTGVILGDLEATMPGFELRSETLARRVVVEDGRTVGVELENRRTGERYIVAAGRVVVCADGLRTPQVLFASGIRPDALGRHLNEHFQINTMLTLSDEFDPTEYSADENTGGSVLVPFSDARPMQGGMVSLVGSPYKTPGTDDSNDRLAVVLWYGAKDIQPSDRVEFSESETDFYGMPKMTIRYVHTPKDLVNRAEMERNSYRAAKRLGELWGPPEFAAGGSSLHYQGTVRMGENNDGGSVCDADLKVWDVDGLYVGGNGVIPTSTAANPTLTTVALAWRAATRIAEALRAEKSAA